MKILNSKNLMDVTLVKLLLVLISSLLVCFVAVLYDTNKSYAEENYSSITSNYDSTDNNEIDEINYKNVEQEENFDFWSWLFGTDNKEVINETGTELSPMNTNEIQEVNQEEQFQGENKDPYYNQDLNNVVTKGDWENEKQIGSGVFEVNPDDNFHEVLGFAYNIRGYIGYGRYGDNNPDLIDGNGRRTADVQFFYNTYTHYLVFLIMRHNGYVIDDNYSTYRYGVGKDTCFENTYSSSYGDIKIWNECEKVYFDDRLTQIGTGCCKNFHKLCYIGLCTPNISTKEINLNTKFIKGKCRFHRICTWAFKSCGHNNKQGKNVFISFYNLDSSPDIYGFDWEDDPRMGRKVNEYTTLVCKAEVEHGLPVPLSKEQIFGRVKDKNTHNTTVEFLDDNNNVVTSTTCDSKNNFKLTLQHGTKGKLHAFYYDDDNILYESFTEATTVTDGLYFIIDNVKRPAFDICGLVFLNTPDGWTKITDAAVDFIEDNGTIYHTNCESPWGMFHFFIYKTMKEGLKGKIHAYTMDKKLDGWMDYTATRYNDYIPSVNVYERETQKCSVSGTIYSSHKYEGVIYVDLLNNNGQVIHKEIIGCDISHTFKFEDIPYDSYVKLHVYTNDYCGDIWTDELHVVNNIDIEKIDIKIEPRNHYNIIFDTHDIVKNITDINGYILKEKVAAEEGRNFYFKIELKNHIHDRIVVEENNREIKPNITGVYTITSVSSDIKIDIYALYPIELNTSKEGIEELEFNNKKIDTSKGNNIIYIPENGSFKINVKPCYGYEINIKDNDCFNKVDEKGIGWIKNITYKVNNINERHNISVISSKLMSHTIQLENDSPDFLQITDIYDNPIDISKPLYSLDKENFRFKIKNSDSYHFDVNVYDNGNIINKENDGTYTIYYIKANHNISIKHFAARFKFTCLAYDTINKNLLKNANVEFINIETGKTIASGNTGENGVAVVDGIQKGTKVKVIIYDDKKIAQSSPFTAEMNWFVIINAFEKHLSLSDKNKNMSLNSNAKNHVDFYNQNTKLASYIIDENNFTADLSNIDFTYAKLYIGDKIFNLSFDVKGNLVLN